jgi:ribosomal protein S6--L-glutamate ligase
LHRGGSGELIKLTKKERRAALIASRVMGLTIAGVDLLQSNRGPLVLEVNASPGLEGIEKATEKNIAGSIVHYVIEQVEKKQIKKTSRKRIKTNA